MKTEEFKKEIESLDVQEIDWEALLDLIFKIILLFLKK